MFHTLYFIRIKGGGECLENLKKSPMKILNNDKKMFMCSDTYKPYT